MSEISKLEQKIIIKKIDKETINIQILDNNILLPIVGEFNVNLIQLEKLTETTLFFRGNSITAKGNADNLFIKNLIASETLNKFSEFPLTVIEFPLKNKVVLVNFSN